MVKKKQNTPSAPLSPEKYIRTKARTLPIEKCLVNADWKESGLASVFVVRKHKSGNRTSGIYLVDTFCLGIKDAFYYFNKDSEEYESIEDRFTGVYNTIEISYNEAHNIIYGAMAYAEELGMNP